MLEKRKSLVLTCCLLFAQATTAQVAQRIDFIDADQQRIDRLDGLEDGHVETGDSATNILAEQTYFSLVDSMQQYIATQNFKEVDQRIYRDYIFRTLRKVHSGNYRRPQKIEAQMNFLLAALKAIKRAQLWPLLRTNYPVALQSVGLFRYEALADTFLREAVQQFPDEVMQAYPQFGDRPFANAVVDKVVATAPHIAKKYYLPSLAVYNAIKYSSDTATKIFLKVIDTYGKKSNAAVLMDDLVNGKLSIATADSITQNNRAYLKQLIQTRIRKNALGEFSVDKELEICALKMVREINDLHNENNEAVRFACIYNLSAEELYMLIVYSEEEIFTSTFNGIYKRLLGRLQGRNAYDFLRSVNEHRFRTFIKQCASYGKLSSFLAAMNEEQRNILMVKFAANLGASENDIGQAVEVADAYTSISDSMVRHIIQRTTLAELEQNTLKQNKRGMAIYGLLNSLLATKAIFQNDWYQEVSGRYQLPRLDVLPLAKLTINNHNRCVWQLYFYDDEDGDWSFRAFVNSFRDANWKIDDTHPLFVKISSANGTAVEIFANKPKQEYEGQAYLEKLFDSLQIVPDVLIHRGHSYYSDKTIDKTQAGTKIFVLGSCGGYHKLSGIIEKAPEVNIISSKQIGVYQVNNPIIKTLADNIREGRDINWQQLWQKVDDKLKNTEAYARFLDYIPPHKNLGAIFIRAYNRMVQ